jgi:hypothetical protein
VTSVMLTFHTETLQRGDVWDRLAPAAESLSKAGAAAAFYVYPFPAVVSGVDISGRIRTIESAGHEVGQHSHFYSGARISKPEKRNDLSEENVHACIARDAAFLRSVGVTPKGFVAGAWHVTDAVLDSLVEEGFSYDCSARTPVHGYGVGGADLEWLTAPAIESRSGGDLVRVPTTCSLGEWFRWGRRVTVEGREPFQVVYLHDYELLRARTRLMLRSFVRFNRERMVSVGERFEDLVTGKRS